MDRTWGLVGAMALGTALLAGCAGARGGAPAAPARLLGGQTPLGKGTVASYAQFDAQGTPAAIGIVFSPGGLDGLPEGSNGRHCVDRNGDGRIARPDECLPTHEHALPLPGAVAERADVPFKWVLLNWNPVGHIPPHIYDVPHFDVHFFMAPMAEIMAIEAGPCGPEFVRCDQFEIARRPVPPNYVHPDFRNVDAVVPAMGNHLIDLTGPEFASTPFTRSWIYGVYDGRITFYEEMVAHAFLLTRPRACAPIKPVPAVATSGFYPTASCIRHDPATGETTVSMESFVYRQASPPAPRP